MGETMLDGNRYHGRLLDLDMHIQPSPDTYEIAAGEVGIQFANMLRQMKDQVPPDQQKRVASLIADETSVFTDETVWSMKGAVAPGAFTADGRLKLMNQMGVARALILADPGIMALTFADNELGLRTMRHWNRFVLAYMEKDPVRLRAAALLNTHDIDVATDEAEQMLKAGCRAFVLPSANPPGKLSPAHPAMDRLWRMIEEADATAVLHAGGEMGFMSSYDWANGVEHLNFRPTDIASECEQINIFAFTTLQYAPQNFLTTIVLGGVFDRFPNLRFGMFELGAGWLGPTAEKLDQINNIYRRRLSGVLSLKPSEYIQRNVRVTPYRFESVADYVDRYGLTDCYCYSSDFPHPEGGTEPLREFATRIDRLGDAYAERFFVTNGEWLLPTAA